MTTERWIDRVGGLEIDDVGFLTLAHSSELGTARCTLHPVPLHDVSTGQPLLYGFAGSRHGVVHVALGIGRVVAHNDARALVELLEGDELDAACVRLGWPSLTPSAEAAP